jgi:hypothetical protein
VRLALTGTAAQSARCTGAWVVADGVLEVDAVAAPGVVDVRCQSASAVALAQVTVTDASLHPVDKPYAGGVIVLKLRRRPEHPWDPLAHTETGLAELDPLLAQLGARVYPAFPFDRSGTRDRSGLESWVLVDIPEGTNFYAAVSALRDNRAVYAESYLPLDAAAVRSRATSDGVTPLGVARRPDEGMVKLPAVRDVSYTPATAQAAIGWELLAIGAPEAWPVSDGRGIGIAVVDTGVDWQHRAIAKNVRTKPYDLGGRDDDGNGLPDGAGANLSQLVILRGAGPPRLATSNTDVSDWSGEGTALAAVAAGTGRKGTRFGVAPAAWILPVDVQENPSGRRGTRALRSSVWSRALGIAYATAEGARVATCAWPAQDAHWILNDAFRYAEDNCVLAVCAVSNRNGERGGFPSEWREYWLRERQGGGGDVFDAWTGTQHSDFFARPLRNVVVAEELGADGLDALAPDLLVPTRSRKGAPGVTSAVANPHNDSKRAEDRKTGVFAGAPIAAGLTAGAAAVVLGRRADLDAFAVREALVSASPDGLRVPEAVDAALAAPKGHCEAPPSHERGVASERPPLWKRIKIKGKYESYDPSAPRPSAGAPEASDRPE